MTVTFTGAIGSPMLRLWPKAPLRAEPEKVIEFMSSTAIALEAAATTAAASCAAALDASVSTASEATIDLLPSMGNASGKWNVWTRHGLYARVARRPDGAVP